MSSWNPKATRGSSEMSRRWARAALPESDPLLMEVLEPVGASGADRRRASSRSAAATARGLDWLKENRGCECHGLEPSAQAVEAAKARGVTVEQGTAEQLPFADRGVRHRHVWFLSLSLRSRRPVSHRLRSGPGVEESWLASDSGFLQSDAVEAQIPSSSPAFTATRWITALCLPGIPRIRITRTKFGITPRAAIPMTPTNGLRRRCCARISSAVSSRLALGTVQFGLPYGIANRVGQVSRNEAAAILDTRAPRDSIRSIRPSPTARASSGWAKSASGSGRSFQNCQRCLMSCTDVAGWVRDSRSRLAASGSGFRRLAWIAAASSAGSSRAARRRRCAARSGRG